VARNSALRAGGYAVGAALFFVVTVVIARYLGVDGFGQYSFVMAVASVFQLVADMGVRNVVIRDLAVDPESVARRLAVARTLLVALSLASMAGIVVVSLLATRDPVVRQSFWLAGAAVMMTFYALGYSAVLRAFERMDADILGFVLHKLLLLALVLALLRTPFGLRGVFAMNLAANTALYLYYRALVSREHGVTRLSRDLGAAWALLAESAPLGVAEVLRRLTWQVDRIVLTALSTPVAVGLFSTAYKFPEAFKPLAQNLTLPLFPSFSRLAASSEEDAVAAAHRALRVLYAVGVPAAVMLAVLSDRIVRLLFGQAYQEAGRALAILAPMALLLLPTALFAYLFTALGRQRWYTRCAAAALVVNLALDLLLIPRLGFVGAAVASTASEAGLFAAFLVALRRYGGLAAGLRPLAGPLAAVVAPAAVCLLARDAALPWVATALVAGAVAYVAALAGLGVIRVSEVREIISLAGASRRGRTAGASPAGNPANMDGP
jgi:O-antigen/teichoic acid export membrane protein